MLRTSAHVPVRGTFARAKRSLLERLLERSPERSMERLLERSLVWSLLVRLMERLMQRLLTRPPLTQVLRGEDASESIGLMKCWLRRQSDPKRPRQ